MTTRKENLVVEDKEKEETMQYYSKLTNKVYDTVEALRKDEAVIYEAREKEKRKNAQRKERAQEIEDARIAYEKAKKKYIDLLNKFLDDYGSYHTTITLDNKDDDSSLVGLVKKIFWGE